MNLSDEYSIRMMRTVGDEILDVSAELMRMLEIQKPGVPMENISYMMRRVASVTESIKQLDDLSKVWALTCSPRRSHTP